MPVKIYDFDVCRTNERNGTYGGLAGDKEGISFEGENWIIKYPKSTKGMRGELASYMTSPLSEYIGSHIYSILGYDAHETRLGIRNRKLVVACRDFCRKEGALREIRTLKNIYNEELSRQLETSLHSTSSYTVDLEELMIQFRYNPILSRIPDLKEHFWNCAVVDILINNNDRNNGNWGLLYENQRYRMAPVYDNGAAFSNKYSDEKIREIMSDGERMQMSSVRTGTVYKLGDKILSAEKLLKVKNPDLKRALKKNVPLIRKNMPLIKEFIEQIPETYGDVSVCSRDRKLFYLKGMELRQKYLLEPALMQHEKSCISTDWEAELE